MLELMYITNILDEAIVADNSGVDIIFIDLEINGKVERQGHLNTLISRHNIEDIKNIKPILKNSKLLVRVNPIHEKSQKEIDMVINYGADIVMLPMYKTKEEVETFIRMIDKRAEVCLLLETSQAFARIDKILEIPGIDRIHIGLNDLHLSFGLDFMFECLSNGIVEYLTTKIKNKDIMYGIGGVARIGEGELPAEMILKEHIRLGSKMVILSRTFRDGTKNLKEEIEKIKCQYKKDLQLSANDLVENKKAVDKIVEKIAFERRKKINVL